MSGDVQPRAARASGAERLYRVLLRAYPRPFRERWGVAMLEVVRQRQARSGGRLAPVALWLLRDVAASLPREWWRTLRGEDRAAGFVRRRRKQRLRRNAMARMLDDFRAAARALARRPMFGLLVALTLARGIGANTAIFSVVRAVVLRPLPFEEAERLVAVRAGQTASKELLDRLRAETRTVERLEAYSGWTVTLTGEGEPEELVGIVATPGLFSLLGTQTQLGRGLLAEDAATGSEPVVVISHGLWQSRFGGDQRVLSSRLQLGTSGRQGEERRRVVGVLAPDFWFPDGHIAAGEVDVVLPLRIDPADREDYGGSWYLTVLGSLVPGSDAGSATAELQQVMRRLAVTDFPGLNDEEALALDRVTTVQGWMVRDVARPLWLLLGAVLLVLLLACANVANLFLVRAAARERELSLRLALGAARGRVVAQLVYEGLLLALLGGALGVGVAAGLVRLLRSRLDGVPRADQIGVDGPVLLFALLLAGASALLCALPPALRATGSSLHSGPGASGGTLAALRASAGAGASTRQHRLQLGLVLVEMALATLLVVGAGLLGRSFARVVAVDPGFEPAGVTTLAVIPAAGRYAENEGWATYFDQLLERLRAVPGVETVGGIHLLPLTPNSWNFPYQAEDNPVPPNTAPPVANYRVVAGDYFQTLRIPVLEGRIFEAADRGGAPPVVVINERMARDLWPAESALGKEIRLFMSSPFTVVGVVGDVHQHRLDQESRAEMYYHLPQMQPTGRLMLMVRGALPSAELVPSLREAVWALDPDVPIGMVATLDEVVAQSVARTRLVAQLTAGFAALALLLGAVGVYGVMSYAASTRRREIGVRMALGADRRAIVGSAVGRGMAWALGGLAAGLFAAAGAGRLLEGMLFQTSARDPFVYATVALALAAVAGVACFVPASRASRLDPVVTLRQE